MAQVVILAASMAATAFQTVGAIKQGAAAQQAADMNAANSRKNASLAISQAASAEALQRKQAAGVIGNTRANIGASGLTIEGSPFDVIQNSVRNSEIDALNIRYGGQQRSQAYMNDVNLSTLEGNNARTNSYYTAGATFLGGAAKVGALAKGFGGTNYDPELDAPEPTLKYTG